MRILAYCIMPNHWHLILQPKSDGMHRKKPSEQGSFTKEGIKPSPYKLTSIFFWRADMLKGMP
ncbi:MAG: hypothetical protein Q8P56_05425 [Candidatus Uhrbacteria bacterium]|nr:hypothetical protein [Candidatus Uhrbacteria bacterium]